MQDLKRDQWTWTKFNDLGLQEFQALIVNYDSKTVLLKREEERWVMPAYFGDDENYESCFLPEFVKDKVQKEVGTWLDLCVLRQVWRQEMHIEKENEGFTFEKAVVLVQCFQSKEHDGRKAKEKGFVWVPMAQALVVYHLFMGARRVIADEIKFIMRNELPEKRLRWQRPGWMETTKSWMKDVLLREQGAHILKPLVTERSSPLGTVIEAETTKGKFFLKCTPPWQNDAADTVILSRVASKYVAAPVAVDVKKQVMVTSNYGEILIPVTFDHADEVKLTRDFVKLQQQAIGRVDDLVCAGVPDFRAEALLKRMAWIAGHTMLDGIAERTGYGDAVQFFRENLSKLQGKVEKLYETGVPSTMTHNDLLLSNVYKAKGGEHFMFFDWVDGYVAHPFTGMLDGVDHDEYIKEWEEYGNMTQLTEWLDAGQGVRIIIESVLWMVEAENTEEPEAGEAFKKVGEKINDVFICFRTEI